jgi:hypothetical protein
MSTHTDTWWEDPANVNDLVWWLIGKLVADRQASRADRPGDAERA